MERLEFLNALQKRGIEFETHAYDGYITLTPDEVLDYLENPDTTLAKHFGVSPEQWAQWKQVGIPQRIPLKEFIKGEYNNLRPNLLYKPILPSLRWEVWEQDNFTCKSCGARQFLTIDHIIPKALGGQDTKDNLQTLCKSCNSKKG